ncbi:MAG: NADH-quinone oxidoreductase subunit NuoE family protein [Armatimonadota bacterium]
MINERIQSVLEGMTVRAGSKAERAGQVLPSLQKIQRELGYIPPEAISAVASFTGLPDSHVYGVTTFYTQFSLEPQGKHIIKLCDGTACHVRKSIPILEALREHLQLSPDEKTTRDRRFSVETVSCLGACGLAPVVVIDEKVYPQMTPKAIVKIVDKLNDMEDGQP